MNYDAIIKELRDIKKLLIIQLVLSGVSTSDVAKIMGMSTKTLYEFLPKNLGKK